MYVPVVLDTFRSRSPTHAAVVVAVGATAYLLGRARPGVVRNSGSGAARAFDRRLAGVILSVWAVIFARDFLPDRIGWGSTLPLHLCDIAGLAAGAVLLCRWRPARVLLHFWGFALCTQAFVTPVLRVGPAHSDFWLYWAQHAAIVVAAYYDVVALGFRPTWRDWRRGALMLAAYALVVLPVDVRLHANYGYLGQTEHAQRSAVTVFGPWPDRLPPLFLAACGVMAGLVVLRRSSRREPERAGWRPSPHAAPHVMPAALAA